MSYRITRSSQQYLNDRNAVRLDALTIAGLTGTPHHRHRGGFFSEAGASPGSPAGDSDATLGSIQDSSRGNSEREGSVVSILSDELGSVVFSDHGEDASDDGNSDVGEGGGAFSRAPLLWKSEEKEKGSGEGGGPGSGEGQGGAETAGGRDGRRGAVGHVGAEEPRQGGAACFTAAGRRVPPGSSATSNCVGSGASSSASSGVRGGDNFFRAADLPRKDEEEHEQRRPTTLPLEHRHHLDGKALDRDGHTTTPASPQKEPQRRSNQRHADDRGTEVVETSAINSSQSHIDSSSSGGGQHPTMRRGSACTAIAADLVAVSGADSGGGGVSPALQTAAPPRPVPTTTCKILVVSGEVAGVSNKRYLCL